MGNKLLFSLDVDVTLKDFVDFSVVSIFIEFSFHLSLRKFAEFFDFFYFV